MKILITGANGYIGMRLLTSFSMTRHQIVAVVRNKDRIPEDIRELFQDRLEILEHDFLTSTHSQITCPTDIDAAYYLIHCMGGQTDFEQKEQTCASNFNHWLAPSNCQQIIYLSGLLPQENKLSRHLKSRHQVDQILRDSEIPVTTLRASIIVGSGSASFEIIRDLVEKLPIMITPKWVLTQCQPISVRNVIDYLVGVLGKEPCHHQSYDIGGPEVMTYLDMLKGFAAARNLKRFVITVPVFTPRISSYWLSVVTATNYQLAKTLVGSLHMETICRESSLQEIISLDLLTYQQAIHRAFSKIAQNRVPSTWYGALSSGSLNLNQLKNIQVPEHGTLRDQQTAPLTTNKDQVIHALWSLGGQSGWPNMIWAWQLRGLIDKLCGGIGMRRGRRSKDELKPGDALDFWRVILADKTHGRLILYAEMKIPGEAWLEFKIKNHTLYQTATFRPRGLFGRLYWYLTYPFHLILFPKMSRILASGWQKIKN